MRILLDGVFSHTGADSRYFNRARTYKGLGAWQGPASPYYKWYYFRKYPEDYGCWWGDRSLPEVTETEPSYLDFIIRDKDSVLHHWLDAGISGWRLDVADELPDGFLTCFYQELKAKEPEAALIGEVWEDASNKESYGIQRQYLSGGETGQRDELCAPKPDAGFCPGENGRPGSGPPVLAAGGELSPGEPVCHAESFGEP